MAGVPARRGRWGGIFSEIHYFFDKPDELGHTIANVK